MHHDSHLFLKKSAINNISTVSEIIMTEQVEFQKTTHQQMKIAFPQFHLWFRQLKHDLDRKLWCKMDSQELADWRIQLQPCDYLYMAGIMISFWTKPLEKANPLSLWLTITKMAISLPFWLGSSKQVHDHLPSIVQNFKNMTSVFSQ